MFELILSCTRDLPKLITCIFKSNSNLLDRCDPDSNHFVEKRREALNSTIDCGSCLVSQYVLISIVLENKGNDGKFFIITEDDWFFQNVEVSIFKYTHFNLFLQLHFDLILIVYGCVINELKIMMLPTIKKSLWSFSTNGTNFNCLV